MSSDNPDLGRFRDQLEGLVDEVSELRDMEALYVLHFALYVLRTEIDLHGADSIDRMVRGRQPGIGSDFVRA